MNSWSAVYRYVLQTLLEAGLPEAEAEAKVITAHAYGGDFSALCLRFFDMCEREREIEGFVKERLSGKPLAYVLNEKFFYGRPFYVDERVLIPRYDTESVAERALAIARKTGCKTVLDLCCGSGAIGITLGAEGDFDVVDFADISEDALFVASKNAALLIPDQKAHFIQGDFLERIDTQYDMIVCNPPYISASDYTALEPQIKDYEPQNALLADSDGYALYERAAKESKAALKPNGALVLEIGDTQADRVCSLLRGNGFLEVEWGCDLGGRPRWVSGRKA